MCTSAGVRRLFVVGVLTLITIITLSSQIMVFWPFLGGATLRTYLVLGPLNVFVILIYVNYYLATTTDPGAVPLHYVRAFATPNAHHRNHPLRIARRKSSDPHTSHAIAKHATVSNRRDPTTVVNADGMSPLISIGLVSLY
ncbi:hypothetical protein BC936DRAFT_146125 [Jimgerdemannia flammicorona]|uniref:Uncharacterized protein n=1 Tax=Jimgerdemannia flammicorona TaxID=994334 RepID=A0A433D8C9_9FUNG|nr:hypothetical protein BC936DRAFT_146125 [Jimgerdemannia flammicorona]